MAENRFKNKAKFLIVLCLGFAAVFSCSQMPEYSEESPTGSILINDGDFYTQSTSVTLSIDVPEADEMCFSNDKVTWTSWETYSASKNWVIESGHWIKTVYGKFRKSGGGSSVISDSIIPLVEQKIFASDGVANTRFGGGDWGFTVSNLYISIDGSTVITGAAFNNNAVYVYKKTGSGWNQSKIDCPNGFNKLFGTAIACTPDAHTLLITEDQKPCFYLYEWDGSSYVQKNIIISPTPATLDDFGVTLSISDDGNKIAVCSWRYLNGTSKGAVYLYDRNKSSWPNYEKRFEGYDSINGDVYSLGVKLSGDGNTIAIGAPRHASNKGAVYIYKWDGLDWIFVKKFTGDSDYLLGRYISMSYNGNRIIASERFWNLGNTTGKGAAHIYDWNGSTYIETKKLTASDGVANDKFGYCVSMSSDGNSIVVSSPLAMGSIGKAYVYRFNGIDWIEEYKLTASDGHANDFYGNMVAISGDGSVVAVGAPYDTVTYAMQGSVYLYY